MIKTLLEFLNHKQINENVLPNGFCLLKPEFTSHDKLFRDYLTTKGWQILNLGETQVSMPLAMNLYAAHHDKDFYGDLCNYMTSAPSHWYSCYKDCDDPIADMNKIKDEIRKEWGKDDMRNAMHSSDSLDNVDREFKIFFKPNNKK